MRLLALPFGIALNHLETFLRRRATLSFSLRYTLKLGWCYLHDIVEQFRDLLGTGEKKRIVSGQILCFGSELTNACLELLLKGNQRFSDKADTTCFHRGENRRRRSFDIVIGSTKTPLIQLAINHGVNNKKEFQEVLRFEQTEELFGGVRWNMVGRGRAVVSKMREAVVDVGEFELSIASIRVEDPRSHNEVPQPRKD